jgi:uncharacterized SAM-binding protein YcdF (DUF218 family)
MFKKHPVISVVALVLAVFLLAFGITGAVIMHHAAGTGGQAQFLLVLGTTVEGREPSPMLQDRIRAAYEYLASHPNTVAILSGYQAAGAEISEAECMHRELLELGVPADRLLMEPNASSTLENFTYSLALIEEKTGTRPEKLGVLSSEFHLLRASMFAEELGVEIFTVPAKTKDLPSFLYWFCREIIMVWYYAIF